MPSAAAHSESNGDVQLTIGTDDGCIRQFLIESRDLICMNRWPFAHSRRVMSIADSGDTFITGAMDGRILLWDRRQKRPIIAHTKAPGGHGVTAVHWTAGEHNLYAGTVAGNVLHADARNWTRMISTTQLYTVPLRKFRMIRSQRMIAVLAESHVIRFISQVDDQVVDERLCDGIVRDIHVPSDKQASSFFTIHENTSVKGHLF